MSPRVLAPLEELFFVDDRPAYPCCCFVRAEFLGSFHRAALEAAIQATLREHPTLTARVTRKGRRFVWVALENPQTLIEWLARSVNGCFPPASHIDLTKEMGIRFQVQEEPNASTLILQFHHAACDGAGIFQFLHDLLKSYASISVGGSAELRSGLSRAANQHKPGPTGKKRLTEILQQFSNLGQAWSYFRRVPSPLLQAPARPSSCRDLEIYPVAICARLTAEETAGLRCAARQLGVRVNDLLVRDTFMACHEWRGRVQDQGGGECLRLAVPMNLRQASDRQVSSAGFVSMVFLDRSETELTDADALLRGIHGELKQYKRSRMAHTLVLAAAAARLLPGGLKKHLWANKCLVSSVLTNLGTVFGRSPLKSDSGRLSAGGVTLEAIDTLPPLRSHMNAGFAVGIYAGQLWVSLHYKAGIVSELQAQKLMHLFLQQIRSSIALLND